MAIWYVDYQGGNDASSGTSFANRKKTIQGLTASDLAPGDTIRVMESRNRGSLNTTALWTHQNCYVYLTTALNALVDDGETAWTASTDVVCTADATIYRANSKSAKIDIAAGFTTGLAAYSALGSTQDYSTYQGLTFWLRVNASLAANTLSLRLCSDTAGVTTVDTFPIPRCNVTNMWVPIYVDKGSALGSSIQSVALYADADPGTIIVYLDNINTVKSSANNDNLNLTTLISKNTANEGWWAIKHILGSNVGLDSAPAMTATAKPRGYWGTTETVTTYGTGVTQTIAHLAASTGDVVQTILDSGNATNQITISGGWNTTDMSTQTGETWFDGMCGNGYGIYWVGYSYYYITLDKLNFCRYYCGAYVGGVKLTIGTMYHAAHGWVHFYHQYSSDWNVTSVICTAGGIYDFSSVGVYVGTAGSTPSAGTFNYYGTLIVVSCGYTSGSFITGFSNGGDLNGTIINRLVSSNHSRYGVLIGSSTTYGLRINSMSANNNGDSGFTHSSNYLDDVRIGDMWTCNNTSYGFVMDLGTYRGLTANSIVTQNNSMYGMYIGATYNRTLIKYLKTYGNGFGGISVTGGPTDKVIILKSSFSEGTPIVFGAAAAMTYSSQGEIILRNYNGTSGDHLTYRGNDVGRIRSNTSVRHTASGMSWRFSPLSTRYVSETLPLKKTLGQIAVAANGLVTMTLWVYRDNTGITAKLVVPGGQIAGVDSDVVATAAGSVDTWEQLSLTFTPTETGTVEIEFRCYGGTTYNVLIDDFNVYQA